MQRYRVLTVNICAITLHDAVITVDRWIRERDRHYINACTTHTVLECYDAPELSAIVNGAGLATPDGMPLVWIGRMYGHRVERVYGPDLLLELCDYGQDRNYRHFFYGGAPGVPELLAKKLQARYAGLQVVGTYSPPFRALSLEEELGVARMINAAAPDIVWVGLGTPKQDYWVGRFSALLEAPALIAIGAAFDIHSGRVRQAPRWIQRSGFEWLFRLIQEPRRLWRRYVIGNPRFIWLLLRQWATGC